MHSVAPTPLSPEAEARGLRIMARLSAMDLPPENACPPVRDADSLLVAFVIGCDLHGRYWASPAMLRRLFWWQDHLPRAERVAVWRDELVDRGDLAIKPLGVDCYGGAIVDLCVLQSRHRFDRFKARPPIPLHIRTAVYERDGHACLHCGATEGLSLDHIHPYSRGGPDTVENLQTLCKSCNSRKGARV